MLCKINAVNHPAEEEEEEKRTFKGEGRSEDPPFLMPPGVSIPLSSLAVCCVARSAKEERENLDL